MGRINLVVLYGGQSAEHDVSCVTAAHVLAAVDPERYRVTPIGISRRGEWALGETTLAALEAGPEALPDRLDPTGAPLPIGSLPATATSPDDGPTVIFPLLHGPLGEDGTVQGMFELADAAYVGSGVLGSALAMDKGAAKEMLGAHGIAQARYRSFHVDDASVALLDGIVEQLGLPLFVKPANMGSSVGVTKAHDRDELVVAIDTAAGYDEWIVVEEAISGREIEVAVLGNRQPIASVPGEIVPGDEFYSYDDKYLDGAADLRIPAPLDDAATDEVRQLAVRVFQVLRCSGLARVDFFYEEGGRGFLCNEANTMPGFTPISMYPKLWQASGLSYPELIDRLVELAIERAAHRRRNTAR